MPEIRAPGRHGRLLLSAAGALALLFAGAPPAARADVVHLADGTEVEGKVLREDAGTVVVQMEQGRVTLDRAMVDRIERRPWAPKSRAEPRPEPAPPGPAGPAPAPAPEPAGGREPLPRPAPAAAPEDPRAAAILGQARAALAPYGPGVDPRRLELTREWSAKLSGLGLPAVPTLAAALGREEHPAVAEALERALAAYPSAVSGAVLVEALKKRGLDAPPPLVRTAGRFGGPEGAAALIDLLDKADQEESEARAKPGAAAGGAARVAALEAFRAAAFNGLARGGQPAGVERLLVRFEAAFAVAGPEPSRERDAARDALCLSLRLAGEEGGMPIVAGALARARGQALDALLDGLIGLRWPALLSAATRVIEETEPLAADTPGRAERRALALRVLQPFVARGDYQPDPGAVELALRLFGDPDEQVRVSAVGLMDLSGEASAVPRLIDLYESDPSSAVQLAAQAVLLRHSGGVNYGEPAAWRAWWNSRRSSP